MKLSCFYVEWVSNSVQLELQVDADYNLQDMKKTCEDLELKGKGYNKKLDDLFIALSKHTEQ